MSVYLSNEREMRAASAFSGMPYERLTEVARTAGRFLARELEASDSTAAS